ncbi:hypothetical protein V2J09_000873 [Rumex salicifolius]
MDRVPASNELSFGVRVSGHSGHLCLEPLPPVEGDHPLRHLPGFVLPPAFPQESADTIKVYITDKYLLPRLDEDEFATDKAGRIWEFNWFDKVKIPLEPSLPRSSVVPSWDLPFRRSREQSLQGKWEPESMQVGISEIAVGEDDSAALPRITGPAKDFVRGSINNRPFRPGGLDASQSLSKAVPDGASTGTWIREVLDGGAANTIPPSFKQGLDLGELNVYPNSWNINKEKGAVKDVVDYKQGDLSLQFDDLFKRAWEEDVTAKDEAEGNELFSTLFSFHF